MEITMIFATIAAFFIKGISGFANTLVFNSILSFSTSNINISPIELLVGFPANIIIAFNKRKESNYRVWLPLLIFVMVGIIPGVVFLKYGNVHLIKVIFGTVIIGIAIEMFAREYCAKKLKISKRVLGVIGIVAGILCGLFGVGAMLAAYIGRTTENNDAFKGNLCIVFLAENTFRIVMYSIAGIITIKGLVAAFKLLPFMLVGLWLGMKCSNLLPERLVKNIVIILLIISGIVLIVTNVV